MSLKEITKEQKQENIKRKLILNGLGYNIKEDGSWGPWLQKLWDKVKIRDKEYTTSIGGLLEKLYDSITSDNKTYSLLNGTLKEREAVYDPKLDYRNYDSNKQYIENPSKWNSKTDVDKVGYELDYYKLKNPKDKKSKRNYLHSQNNE